VYKAWFTKRAVTRQMASVDADATNYSGYLDEGREIVTSNRQAVIECELNKV